MTWEESLAFREKLESIDTLTPAQLAHADTLCDEFGVTFDGIRDRVEAVGCALYIHQQFNTPETAEQLGAAVQYVDAGQGSRGLLGDDFQRIRKELKRLKQACRDADDALLAHLGLDHSYFERKPGSP